MKPIYLIGFMGTGKSTFGKRLAFAMNFKFIDLDEFIESKENLKIAEIFNNYGESRFRELESFYLKSINETDIIISCGGGTPCFNNNINFINSNGLSIYLKTNRGILISRLIYNKSKRPLLADKTDTELLKFINELIDKREPFYLKAKITFQMDKSKLDELIYAIIHAENECIK